MIKLFKYRYLIALIILLASVLAAFQLPHLQVNNSIEQFLSEDDPQYSFYKEIHAELADDSNLLFLALQNTPDIYEYSFLRRAEKLMSRLDSVPQIRSVSDITRSRYPSRSMIGITTLPYLNIKADNSPSELKAKIERDTLYSSNYVSSNGTALLIYLELKRNLNQKQIEEALSKINGLLREWPEGTAFLWGRQYVKNALDSISKSEMTRSLGLGFLFLGLVLLLILRNWQAVLVIFGSILSIIIIYYGILAMLGVPTNLMTNLLPTIILISGISDLIHLSVRAQKGFDAEKGVFEVYSSTLREVGRAIFVTSFTTAIGFFSLLLSPIPVLQGFGLQAGLAVLMTFGLIVLIFPAIVAFRGTHLLELRPAFRGFSYGLINNLAFVSRRFPGRIIGLVLILLVFAAVGIGNINTNNAQHSMPDSGTLRDNHTFFETEFGGARTLELYIRSRTGESLLQPGIFNKLSEVHSFLDSLPYLSRITSPVSFYELIRRSTGGHGRQSEYRPEEIRRYARVLNQWPSKNYLLNQEKSLLKFRGQMHDVGREQAQAKYAEIESEVQRRLGTSKVEVRINGLEYLYDRTHAERISNMLVGLLIAILVVTLVLGYLFKDITLAMMALLLNIIPIFLGAGVMGLTNLELRAGTSIVFTIAFVIAVDDTIHFLTKYRWERKRGSDVESAIQTTLKQCGSAIFATSAILVGAFLILMVSSLNEIAAFGFLTAVIIILALLLDLLLLPILIRRSVRKKSDENI